ncbi:MAG: hypothetical protein Q4D26_11485 [Clostridia bacterium]|nr:hypothetical protein [Clostridia bacterium]
MDVKCLLMWGSALAILILLSMSQRFLEIYECEYNSNPDSVGTKISIGLIVVSFILLGCSMLLYIILELKLLFDILRCLYG